MVSLSAVRAIYLAEYKAIRPAMKGRDMKASPARAIGSFSASLISSILELKYSSGSFSLVRGLGPSPSPSPNPIFTAVFGTEVAVVLATLIDVEGANAVAEIRTVAISAAMRLMRYMMGKLNFYRDGEITIVGVLLM